MTESTSIPLAVGTWLEDRYRIRGLLGQGGMSRVYLAEDTRLGLRVAVKENLQTSAQACAQFEREAQMLARLSHPNIPRVTDRFAEAGTGRQCLVMEYIEGEDLAAMVQRVGALPEATALNWIRQILGAVEYLHSQSPPVIHRDIKPANIKITPQGKAVLVDFGIAKLYDPRRGTATGLPAVTPGYAPPEQYGLRTTQRSDLYALGATLYTLVTGQTPPEAPLRQAGEEGLVPPGRLAAVSPQTEQAILRAMELENTRRWQSASALRAALEGQATSAYSPPPTTLAVTGPQRRNLIAPLAAVTIGIAIIVVAIMVAQSVRSVTVKVAQSSPTPQATESALLSPVDTLPSQEPTATAQPAATSTPPTGELAVDSKLVTPNPTPKPDGWVEYDTELRAGPGRGFEKKGVLGHGHTVTILSRYTDGSTWFEVITDAGERGWVEYSWLALNIPLTAIPVTAGIPATPEASATSIWLVADDFKNNDNGWGEATGKSYFEAGTFHVKQTTAGYSYWPYCAFCGNFFDFAYEASITKIEGRDEYAYGITFRGDGGHNFYRFGINGEGGFIFSKLVSNSWQPIVPWTESAAIHQGNSRNKLRVICYGSDLQLYINDQLVGRATDNTFQSGRIGVGVDRVGLHIAVEYVRVWRVDTAASAPAAVAPAGTPTIPPGMGGLIISHDYGDEMNYDIGGKLHKIPPGGEEYIFLAPGRYTFSWNTVREQLRPDCATANGCTVDIVEGRYYRQHWVDRP